MKNNVNKKHLKRKKQLGFAGMGFMEYMIIVTAILSIASAFFLPQMKMQKEQEIADDIVHTFFVISQAAYTSEYGSKNNYTGADLDKLSNTLPQGFVKTVNGEVFTFAPDSSNPTRFNISTNIPNERIYERVKAKFDVGQYTKTGDTFSVTGP